MPHFIHWFLSCIKLREMILLGWILIALFFSQKDSYAQSIPGSFNFEGHNRDYMVFLPNNYADKFDFPLVIYLHSYDWTAEIEMDYTQMHLVADTSGFILVTPNAFERRWNSGENPDWPAPDVDDVGFINALIDTLSNHYTNIDHERIYTCGFSAGGTMSYKLACQLSNRIAAIASVSGPISTGTAANCNLLHTMPVLHIHGTADSLISINGNTYIYSVDQTINYFADLNGCVQLDTILLPYLLQSDQWRA